MTDLDPNGAAKPVASPMLAIDQQRLAQALTAERVYEHVDRSHSIRYVGGTREHAQRRVKEAN